MWSDIAIDHLDKPPKIGPNGTTASVDKLVESERAAHHSPGFYTTRPIHVSRSPEQAGSSRHLALPRMSHGESHGKGR